MKNNTPFHVAFGMTDDMASVAILDRYERVAMSIIFGELEGAKFNWRDMAWEKPQ